jgi:hypothetical protein
MQTTPAQCPVTACAFTSDLFGDKGTSTSVGKSLNLIWKKRETTPG